MRSAVPLVRLKILLLVCTGILLILSLTQPGIYIDNEDAWPSTDIFFWGWFGLMSGDPTYLLWLANPLLILSGILLFRKIRLAAAFSFLAAVLAFFFPVLHLHYL